jgi:hypothetical protein
MSEIGGTRGSSPEDGAGLAGVRPHVPTSRGVARGRSCSVPGRGLHGPDVPADACGRGRRARGGGDPEPGGALCFCLRAH